MENDKKPRCSSCVAIEPHNFKFLAFLLYGYHDPQLKNIAIPAIAFSPPKFQTCTNPLIGTNQQIKKGPQPQSNTAQSLFCKLPS